MTMFALQMRRLLEREDISIIRQFFISLLILKGPCYKFIMESITALTPSPSKRSTFRSKTKLKQLGSTMQSKLKTMPLFYVYLKEFPLQTGEQVLNIVRSLEPTHNTFLQNLDNLKLYRPQLTATFEDSWSDFMSVLKSVVVKLLKRTDRLMEEKQKKIDSLLQLNRQLQNRQVNWKQKIEKIEHLRQLQSAQLSMADTELEMVSSQMRDIYKLLQGDMNKVSSYLTKLQKDRVIVEEEGSNDIFGSLKTLSLLMGNMENQQRLAGANLTNMRQLIKSMAKCSKVTTATQVDESQLLTQAGAIFNNAQQDLPFDEAQALAVNVDISQGGHLIDQLKVKEKNLPPENFKMEKHADKPWSLTPVLIAFLQNMSKNNETGKVLPWLYTKQLIDEIYEQRVAYEGQMMVGGVGNGMSFDQFVVFYFLNKHRIRRLAETKLLEFIISLKYYSRYWTKAQMFCQLMDVMRYFPLFDNIDGFNYKMDYNTQNFFFVVYRKMITYKSFEEEGATYVQVKNAKKLMKASLFFTDEVNRSRLVSKIYKDVRIFDGDEYCDFDYTISLMIDEYFAVKKRMCGILTRCFSRKFQQNQGYFSIDQMKDLFTQHAYLYRAGDDMQYRFPIKSQLQIAKLYLYTATSGKNGYDFNVNTFIAAAQRYGFDAPFPFLHMCSKMKKNKTETRQGVDLQKKIEISQEKKQSSKIQRHIIKIQGQEIVQQPEGTNLAKERVNVGVKIFSQHFSLLRQLYGYVDIFSKTLKDEKNPELLWKSFNQIKTILQRGCQFMRYPLINQKKI